MNDELKGVDAIKVTTVLFPAEPSKEQKVFQLTVELHDTKQQKKDSNKAFNEEIKRIQEEIDALLTDDQETEKTND